MARIDEIEKNLADAGIPFSWLWTLILRLIYYWLIGYAMFNGAHYAGFQP